MAYSSVAEDNIGQKEKGTTMQISNELFAILFSIVMVIAVVWFIRAVSKYKLWIKLRSEATHQPSASTHQEKQE